MLRAWGQSRYRWPFRMRSFDDTSRLFKRNNPRPASVRDASEGVRIHRVWVNHRSNWQIVAAANDTLVQPKKKLPSSPERGER